MDILLRLINSVESITTNIYIYVLSVYSPFSDRVGLPLHNILSPFIYIIIIFIQSPISNVHIETSSVDYITITYIYNN